MSGLTVRPLRDEADWAAIRGLLVRTHGRPMPGWNWTIRRWDGWRFHGEQPLGPDELGRAVTVWEAPNGQLVGAVHPEGRGEAWLELDPDRRDLEPAMIREAERRLAVADEAGRTILDVWAFDEDRVRTSLLAASGYVRREPGGWLRWLRFGESPPLRADPVAGYDVRTTRPGADDPTRMADLLNAAFGRSSHTTREYRSFMEASPSFENDLNLVATAPDGGFAAHVGLTYDAANRHGVVEPVCTHPDHRRAGLARALLLEGLGRIHERGAASAEVETGEGEAANALYASCGFREAHRSHAWRRVI